MSVKIGELTLYSVEELALALGVNKDVVIQYCEEGAIKGNQFGGRWFVSEKALNEYFNKPEDEQSDNLNSKQLRALKVIEKYKSYENKL